MKYENQCMCRYINDNVRRYNNIKIGFVFAITSEWKMLEF